MKYKVCISVDEETLVQIREHVRNGRFRNRSHAFEYAIQKEFLDNSIDDKEVPVREIPPQESNIQLIFKGFL